MLLSSDVFFIVEQTPDQSLPVDIEFDMTGFVNLTLKMSWAHH